MPKNYKDTDADEKRLVKSYNRNEKKNKGSKEKTVASKKEKKIRPEAKRFTTKKHPKKNNDQSQKVNNKKYKLKKVHVISDEEDEEEESNEEGEFFDENEQAMDSESDTEIESENESISSKNSDAEDCDDYYPETQPIFEKIQKKGRSFQAKTMLSQKKLKMMLKPLRLLKPLNLLKTLKPLFLMDGKCITKFQPKTLILISGRRPTHLGKRFLLGQTIIYTTTLRQ